MPHSAYLPLRHPVVIIIIIITVLKIAAASSNNSLSFSLTTTHKRSMNPTQRILNDCKDRLSRDTHTHTHTEPLASRLLHPTRALSSAPYFSRSLTHTLLVSLSSFMTSRTAPSPSGGWPSSRISRSCVCVCVYLSFFLLCSSLCLYLWVSPRPLTKRAQHGASERTSVFMYLLFSFRLRSFFVFFVFVFTRSAALHL